MSFDNSSSFGHWNASLNSSSDSQSLPRPNRQTHSVWGQSTAHSGSRRGLTPIATSNLSSTVGLGTRRQPNSIEPDSYNSTTSPSNANFPPLVASSTGRFSSQRATPPGSSNSNSPITILQAGAHQQQSFASGRTVTSPRSRTTTPSQQSAGGTGNHSQAGSGGGGGGGYSAGIKSGAYSPSLVGQGVVSPTSYNFERSSSISSTVSSAALGQSSLSKISATQVLLLLDTITEKEGKAKWDTKAEKIRKLLDSNGMEVFIQFFRRVVASNASVIFSGTREQDQGSYKLLRQELDKVPSDPDQANRIAEAIDTSKEDFFRDFNLATFVKHFFTDPVPQSLLAIAFTNSSKADLRNKAEKILTEIGESFLRSLSDGRNSSQSVATRNIAILIEHYALSKILSTPEQKYDLYWAVNNRYEKSNIELPTEVSTAFQLLRLPQSSLEIIRQIQRVGTRCTSSVPATEDFIQAVGIGQFQEAEVAAVLLFMTLSIQDFDLNNFALAIKSKLQPRSLDWNLVLGGFDIPGIRIRTDDFLRIYNSLLQISTDESDMDIQKLWGGTWQNLQTQVSFLKAYLSVPAADVNPSRIPHFRSIYNPEDFTTLSADSRKHIESEIKDQFLSADANHAIFEVLLGPDIPPDDQDRMDILREVYQNHSTAFLLSLSGVVSKSWVQDQEKFVAECFSAFLEKRRSDSEYVLEALYAQDPQFTFNLCTLVFQLDPRQTEIVYQRAEDFGWIEEFLKHWSNPLALDIACMRNKLLPGFDLDDYVSQAARNQPNLGMVLCKYLRIKADDEYRVQREQTPPQSIPLSLRTVHTLLEKLEDHLDSRDLVKAAQTTCLQTYPRLMNYGAGFDDILERSSDEKGNKLPEEIDKQMSDLFGRMYRSELSIRDMVNEMRFFKTSRDAEKQDLFCCIVHGLFDEYVCYSEYPEDALEKTALLFGSIIKYKLLPTIPREFGLSLILDAVREHETDSLMNRFGVEALLQISDQLSEWPGLCGLLLQVPSLQHPEILQRAREGLRNQPSENTDPSGNAPRDHFATSNGTLDEFSKQEIMPRGFKSLVAEPPPVSSHFQDPEQKVQEKMLFVINNLSKDNMPTKLSDLKECLTQEHHQWFASYIVEQRARLEPNNQEMYFSFVSMLEDELLMAEILRETYTSIVKLMNAESTITSATERSHLKNLGAWLGALTLAQNKPIKHKNIYFIDLLIEGYDTQRLVVVIPFTCKVLAQGVDSLVFKPPNPWLMEIIHVLKELYLFAELKLNLKFEIEVLCKDLKLEFKKLEPANVIRDRPQIDDDITNASAMPDVLESFDELSLNGAMNRGIRERLSAPDIMATLPNLEDSLRYPPTSGTPGDQALMKSIIYRAFDQAIQEIIAPVVERSITIASISTAQLISKDYALEPDVEKYRDAARKMVKSLAGSLALVTCKEPLRMSITNYIRRPAQEDLPEQLMPEGAILMCVNDNLDIACRFIKEAAEDRSIPEIDHVIEPDLEERRRFSAEGGNREFLSANVNRWSAWIPEPFKQTVGGLNDSQRAVYEDFDRRVHGMNASHVQNASTDSTGRQIPDVLQDALALPNLSTPADQPILPHQSPLGQQEPRMTSTSQQSRLNGFTDNIPPHERISILIDDVQKAARSSDAKRLKDLEKNSSIFQDFRQILIVLTSSTRPAADLLARQIAEKICNIFASKPPKDSLESEVLAFLLTKLCQLSELIIRDVLRWMTANEELLFSNSSVIAALVIVGLMDFARVDAAIALTLNNRSQHGLETLSDLLDQTLFSDEPLALRADFANSLLAMCAWLQENPDMEVAKSINQKLRTHGMPEVVSVALTDKAKAKQDQMRYIFDEWIGIFENLGINDSAYAAFLREMHRGQIINSTEDLADFLRQCLDTCVDGFEREAQLVRGSLDSAFSQTDALAKLIIMLLQFQGDTNGAVRINKAPYFETILSVIVLILNHHQVMRGVALHQRVFSRLFSAILYEYSSSRLDEVPEHNDLMLVVAKTFRSLQPAWFPGFVYAWTSLIMHRVFVTGMLGSGNPAAMAAYRELVGLSLLYPAELLRSTGLEGVSADLYRGVLRNMLVLHHDYPEFLCDNHSYFCSRIPYHVPQLRNLILTSRPSAYHDLPDPMTPGLKIERLEEMRKPPSLVEDIAAPLERQALDETIQSALQTNGDLDSAVKKIRAFLEEDVSPPSVTAPRKSTEILNALIPYVGKDALDEGADRFDQSSIHVVFLVKLAFALSFEARYQLFNAIADQIRYPNTHTDYFCQLMLHLWGTGNVNDQQRELREPISRVIYERLAVARPHPWGITVLSLELQRTAAYGFWETLASEGSMQQRLQQAMRTPH